MAVKTEREKDDGGTEVMVTTGAIRRAKLRSNCQHQTHRHPMFYRLDVLVVHHTTSSVTALKGEASKQASLFATSENTQ